MDAPSRIGKRKDLYPSYHEGSQLQARLDFKRLPQRVADTLKKTRNPIFYPQPIRSLSDLSLRKHTFTVQLRQNAKRDIILDPSSLLKAFFAEENLSLPGMQHFKSLIEAVTRFNENPDGQDVHTMVSIHAELRLILFFYLCTAYTGLNYNPLSDASSSMRWQGAQIQLGQGIKKQAAHHTLLPHIDDASMDHIKNTFSLEFREAAKGSGPISPQSVILVLSLGVEPEVLEHWYNEAVNNPQASEEALSHIFKHWDSNSILGKHSLFYFINNHTLKAPGSVNLLDSLLENVLRSDARKLLNQVSNKKIESDMALNELARKIQHILQFTNEVLPELLKLVKAVNLQREILVDLQKFQNLNDLTTLERLNKELDVYETCLTSLLNYTRRDGLSEKIVNVLNFNFNDSVLIQISETRKILKEHVHNVKSTDHWDYEESRTRMDMMDNERSIRNEEYLISRIQHQIVNTPSQYSQQMYLEDYRYYSSKLTEHLQTIEIGTEKGYRIYERFRNETANLELSRVKQSRTFHQLTENFASLMEKTRLAIDNLEEMQTWIPDQIEGTKRVALFLRSVPPQHDASYRGLQPLLLSRNIYSLTTG